MRINEPHTNSNVSPWRPSFPVPDILSDRIGKVAAATFTGPPDDGARRIEQGPTRGISEPDSSGGARVCGEGDLSGLQEEACDDLAGDRNVRAPLAAAR